MRNEDTMSDPTNPATIEADIARTREDLAKTVDELSYRLDPKRAAKDNAPMLGAGAAAVTVLVVALVVLRRRRR